MIHEIESLESRGDRLNRPCTPRSQRGAVVQWEQQFFQPCLRAVERVPIASHSECPKLLQQNARLALSKGEAEEARRLADSALAIDDSVAHSQEWSTLLNPDAWSDAWLISAVRCDPPDTAALNALAERYWRGLYARCQSLTFHSEKAADLAQQAWCKVLQTRQRLDPDGNFPAYIAMVATNLWRDSHRAAQRAGAMADNQMLPLDTDVSDDSIGAVILQDVLPDLMPCGTSSENSSQSISTTHWNACRRCFVMCSSRAI